MVDTVRPVASEPGDDEAAFCSSLRPPGLGRRLLGSRLTRGVVSLALGLAAAEGAFRVRDDGAFPHLNVYEADPELGVRLRPGATERVRVADNAPTAVRINGIGFRGAPWPASARLAPQALIVGDSQVFGLGVEEGETFAAQLDAAGLAAPVRNAGVPTLGPPEYNALLRDLLASRRVRAVVYVVNLANDLFESVRPNRERHAVWDGWAVRKESAPPDAAGASPLLSYVRRESHAVFAWRRWLYYARGGAALDRVGLPSEGSWHELVEADEVARSARSRLEAAERTAGEQVRRAGEALGRAERAVRDTRVIEPVRYLAPIDIVSDWAYGEGGRPIELTASELASYAAARKRAAAAEDALRSARQALATAERTANEARVEALRSPLTSVLREAQALCEKHGARLIVVALPLDVQVSNDEWAKYGVKDPIDVTSTRSLAVDVVTAARALGALAVDTTDALRAAEPGAFLRGDLHLTPRGHTAVARAIEPALRQALQGGELGSGLSTRGQRPRTFVRFVLGHCAARTHFVLRQRGDQAKTRENSTPNGGTRRAPGAAMTRRRDLVAYALAAALVGCGDAQEGSAEDAGGAGTAVQFGDKSLLTDEFRVKTGEEKFLCYARTLDEDMTLDGFDWKPTALVHHLLMVRTMAPEPEGFSECKVLFRPTWMPMFAATTAPTRLEMPAGTGLKLKKGDQIMVQLHLLNVSPEEASNRAEIRMRRTASEDVEPVGFFAFGRSDFSLPPAQSSSVVSRCTLKKPISIFAAGPHMHYLGKKLTFEIEQDGAMNEVFRRDPYTFDDQRLEPVVMELPAGTRTRTTCTFANNRDSAVTFGESSSDEMCFFAAFVRGQSGLDVCLGDGQDDLPQRLDPPRRHNVATVGPRGGASVQTVKDPRSFGEGARLDPCSGLRSGRMPPPSPAQAPLEPAAYRLAAEETPVPEAPPPRASWALLPLAVLLPLATDSVETFTHMCGKDFFDPIPTPMHLALVWSVPLLNLVVGWWRGPTYRRGARWMAVATGFSTGVAAFYTLLFLPMLPLAIFAIVYMGLGLLPLTPVLSLIMGLLVGRSTPSTGAGLRSKLGLGLCGAAAAWAVLLLAEAPHTWTAHWLQQATNASPERRVEAVQMLRRFADKELMLRACYVRQGRATDLASLALGLKDVSPDAARDVYYRVTGAPFHSAPRPESLRGRGGFWDSDEPDAWDPDRGGDKVGARANHLSLASSRIDGSVDPSAALAYTEWTLEFKNDGATQSEARAEVLLPPGGVVSRATLWIGGEEREAAFASRSKARQAYERVVRQRRDPLLVTTSGPGRALVQCFPVQPGSTMKIRIGVTSPLALSAPGQGALWLPQFSDRNFRVPASLSHAVWIESKGELRAELASLAPERTPDGAFALRGAAPADALEAGIRVVALRDPSLASAFHKTADALYTQRLEATTERPPSSLIVVLDGSRSLCKHYPGVASALAALPREMRREILLAGDTVRTISTVAEARCEGGQDSGPALHEALSRAARDRDAVVLWFHGAQGVSAEKADAVRQLLERRPLRLLAVQMERGPNPLLASLAGAPGVEALRATSPSEAASSLVAGWGGRPKIELVRARCEQACAEPAGKATSRHLAKLWVYDQVQRAVATPGPDDDEEARRLAIEHTLVTPLTGAVVLETAAEMAQAGLDPAGSSRVPTVPEPSLYVLLLVSLGFGARALRKAGVRWTAA